MVDDITQEKDVELIVDLHRDPLFSDAPLPRTTPNTNIDALCKEYDWKFCTNLGNSDMNDKHRLFYTCEVYMYLCSIGTSIITRGRLTYLPSYVLPTLSSSNRHVISLQKSTVHTLMEERGSLVASSMITQDGSLYMPLILL